MPWISSDNPPSFEWPTRRRAIDKRTKSYRSRGTLRVCGRINGDTLVLRYLVNLFSILVSLLPRNTSGAENPPSKFTGPPIRVHQSPRNHMTFVIANLFRTKHRQTI